MTAKTSGQYPIFTSLTEIPDGLLRAGRESFAGFSITVLATTPSTQDMVRNAVLDGSPQGFCCVALEQTEGRGRQGRNWFGKPGESLQVSIAVATPPGAPHALPFVAGLAIHDTAAAFGVAADIKWPNDILVADRKLAGTLVEGIGATELASVGIGVNIDIGVFPEGMAGSSLAQEAGRKICWQEVLEGLLPRLRTRLDQTARDGFESTVASWSKRSSSIGKMITATTARGTVVGRALGVDEDGALLLRTDKGVARLLAADVHISPEP
jgi:BirA family transcriptional regulator, biotin operon repressor / biotin---[acetyl-CoA-carboxylase] ligase